MKGVLWWSLNFFKIDGARVFATDAEKAVIHDVQSPFHDVLSR